jgi:hypothetical protein
MTLTLVLIDIGFDLSRSFVPDVIPTSLVLAPEPSFVGALLALPRTNEQISKHPVGAEAVPVEEQDLELDTSVDEPGWCVAMFGGPNDRSEGMATWELTASQLKAVRAEILGDNEWWAATGHHNRAVLAFINELPDSTKVVVLQSGPAPTPSN